MTSNHELAHRFGTPLYVYELDRVSEAYRDLRNSLPDGCGIFYSLKANPHPEVVRALREAGGASGCRAEVCSVGELAIALEAGFPAASCLYTGPGKTEYELFNAMSQGVRTFSVESPTDLERVGAIASKLGLVVDCLLRVNSQSGTAATSIRMTGTPSQFGFDSETLEAKLPMLGSVPGTRLVGAHLFSQSNARDEEGLIAELRHSVEVAAMLHSEVGLPMNFLDLGGGFGCPYAAPGKRPVYGRLRAELENSLDLNFPRWRMGEPEIACESGRYLAGDCGKLITAVTNIKDSRGQRFIILDAGINTLGGMSGLGRILPVAITPGDHVTDSARQTAHLVGPLCTPADILGRNVQVPRLKPGDVIAIPNVGAYGATASLLLFLGRPAPGELVLRGGQVESMSRLDVHRDYASDHDVSASGRRAGYLLHGLRSA